MEENKENTAEQPQKRIRRTKKDIESRLFNGALAVIEEVGFSNLTIKALAQKAAIEPPVFYNRYQDMDDFVDKFVRRYDYWLGDSIKLNIKNDPIDEMSNIINGLVDSLLDNPCMQQLLAWELCENNDITRRTAQNREFNAKQLINYYEDILKDCDISFDYSTAIIVGGIYYLILHRKRATFNFVDYTKKENIEELKKNIRKIITKIYSDYDDKSSDTSSNPKAIQIAKKLIANKVDFEIIKDSTGLNEQTLKSLYV